MTSSLVRATSFTFLIALSGVLLFPANSRGQTSVAERYNEVVSMARYVVWNRRDVIRESEKPKFHICGSRHLHWYRGCVSVDGEAFPMDARLQVEWFWKHLSPSERRFWEPYIRQIGQLVVQYMQAAEQREMTDEEWMQYANSVDSIYRDGAAEYARRHGATFLEEDVPDLCCAAAHAEIVITTKVEGVASIQWATAGSVWLSLSTTSAEPQYQTFVPGSTVAVAPGSLYYYRLVLEDGRMSKRVMAPDILGSTAQLSLAWQ